MIQMSFTAQELIAMAILGKKKKIYGIPDVISGIPQEQKSAIKNQIVDKLIDEKIAILNLDGVISLSEDYSALIDACCDCSMCMTVNIQRADGTDADYIFWDVMDSISMATVYEDKYCFAQCSKSDVEAFLPRFSPQATENNQERIVLTNNVLSHAKEKCRMNSIQDAERLLKQNGADAKAASVIIAGLQNRADYIGVLVMDNRNGACEQRSVSFLAFGNTIFSLEQTVSNLRTSTEFTPVSSDCANSKLNDLIAAFRNEAGEANE